LATAEAPSQKLSGSAADLEALVDRLALDPEVIKAFDAAGGKDKPRFGQLHVCWDESEEEAKKTALEWWPNAVASGKLPWELPLPSHFESASEWADEDAIAEAISTSTSTRPAPTRKGSCGSPSASFCPRSRTSANARP